MSATWELHAPNATPPTTNYWSAVPDIDGDGFADLAVVDPGTDALSGYLGGSSGLDPTVDMYLNTIGPIATVDVAGDVDGDGYVDLVVCDANSEGAAIVHGGARPQEGMSFTRLTRPAMLPAGSSTCAGVGDVNGDGFADVVVVYGRNDSRPSSPVQPDVPRVYLYAGTNGALDEVVPQPVAPPVMLSEPDRFGESVAAVGDVNGDGLSDFGVGMEAESLTSRQEAVLYYGRQGSLSALASLELPRGATGDSMAYYAFQVLAVGDISGDGIPDLVVPESASAGYQTPLQAFVFVGSSSQVSSTPSGSFQIGSYASPPDLSVGDFDGDGRLELVDSTTHGADIYSLVNGTFGPNRVATVALPSGVTAFTQGFAAADFNRDGFDDLVLADPNQGTVVVYAGATSGIAPASPSLTIGGSGSMSFGASFVP